MNRMLVFGLVFACVSSFALAEAKSKGPPPVPPVPVVVPSPAPPVVQAVPDPSDKTTQERVDAVNTALDTIDITIQRPNTPDEELADARDHIPPLQDELNMIIDTLEPELAGVNARLTELGDAPEDAVENTDVTQDRDSETKKKQILEDSLKRANLLELKAKELLVQIAKSRREEFSTQLYARTPTIFGPTHWKALFANVPADWHRFTDRLSDGVRTLRGGLMGKTTVFFVLSLVLCGFLVFPGVYLAGMFGRRIASRF
ncbi:MAG: DUF3772 domain-containing protein, partial [Clostridia bacterium]|nr:DUF3772 domain-containing protein [Deltaproteobacteria bacterium]